MFNRNILKTCFTGLVGWRDSANNGCVPALDIYNKTSSSGIFMDGVPGLRLETIYACMSKDFTSDATGFNAYLKRLYEDCMWDLIEEYFTLQKQSLDGKTILTNQELGYRVLVSRSYVSKVSRFVGIEFKPYDAKDYCTELLYWGLWLKQAQTGANKLTLYLYESQKLNALTTFQLDYTDAGSLQLFALKEKLEPALRFITQGGVYYLGYYEDDLLPDNEAADTRRTCSTCEGASNNPFRKYAPYVNIRPFTVASGRTYSDRTLFDIQAVGYTDQSFGMTASINITCDLSNILCDNIDLFASILQKRIAVNAFWQIYNTKELGPQAELSKEDARLMAEKLELDVQAKLKKLILDFEDVNCDCIGNRRNSISMMGM